MVTKVQVFASSVARRVARDKDEGVGIIEWIALILPLIAALPCFKPKTPAEHQAWIKANRDKAARQAVTQLRRNATEKMKRRSARPIADEMVAKACSMSAKEFAALVEDAT